jgi:ubiquinone/menaquinone biosynthesis C-methylase UbiE
MGALILRKIYWWLEKKIVPGLTNSQYYYKRKLFENLPDQKFMWLDLGCGRQVFGAWMRSEQQEMLSKVRFAVGIDRDLPALKAHTGFDAKICADLEAIPLKDRTFDVITANMVVEHLAKPDEVFCEVYRLLRSDGIFVFHTSNAANPFIRTAAKLPQGLKNGVVYLLENRKAEDVFPTHYKVNRPKEVRAVAADAGFAVEEIEMASTSAFTQMITPLALLELLWVRLLQRPGLQHLQTNLICVLKKKAAAAEAR